MLTQSLWVAAKGENIKYRDSFTVHVNGGAIRLTAFRATADVNNVLGRYVLGS